MLEIVPQEKIPTKSEAQNMIRELIRLDRVSWTLHSKQRMQEREISIPEIRNCLEKGVVTEEPYRVYELGGGYRTTIEKRSAGRFLKVILTLKYTQRILIITALNV